MPICDRCSTAYLVEERHKCQPPSRSVVPAFLGLVFGAIFGAAAGFWVALAMVVLSDDFRHAGVVVFFVGLPLGALAGAISGVTAATKNVSQ